MHGRQRHALGGATGKKKRGAVGEVRCGGETVSWRMLQQQQRRRQQRPSGRFGHGSRPLMGRSAVPCRVSFPSFPSVLPSFHPSILLSFLPSFLLSFLPSFLPPFLVRRLSPPSVSPLACSLTAADRPVLCLPRSFPRTPLRSALSSHLLIPHFICISFASPLHLLCIVVSSHLITPSSPSPSPLNPPLSLVHPKGQPESSSDASPLSIVRLLPLSTLD